MAKETEKKDPGYDVKSDSEAEEMAIAELKIFQKGFGIDIETFEEEKDLPESLKKIIRQYYVAALVMIPNSFVPGFPYKNKRFSFQTIEENVRNRCKRIIKEIQHIISLYKKLNETTNEKARRRLTTYIKLLETDLVNNIAHMYDVGNTIGNNDGREEREFEANYSSNAYLAHQYGTEREKETTKRAINKFIGNSLSELNSDVGNSTPIDLKKFLVSFVQGARTNLLYLKDRGIIELSNREAFDVTPVVMEDRPIEGGRQRNRDWIMFIGKNGITALVHWHLGVSGVFSDYTDFSQFPRLNAENVGLLVSRKMPNFEIIERSVDIRQGSPRTINYKSLSTLDILRDIAFLTLRIRSYQERIQPETQAQKQTKPLDSDKMQRQIKIDRVLRRELRRAIRDKLPSEPDQNAAKLFELAGVSGIVALLQENSVEH